MNTTTRQFRSKSSPNSPPHIATLTDGVVTFCTCPAWRNKKADAPRDCPHNRIVNSERGSAAAAPSPAAAAPVLLPSARVSPMLASAMTDKVEGVQFDWTYGDDAWAMEEKIDGHRCVVVVQGGAVAAHSRPRAGAQDAKVRALPANILDQLRRFPDGVYDGELVAATGKAWDVTAIGAVLVLVLFDVLETQGRDVTAAPYHQRRAILLGILGRMPAGQTAISTVESLPPSWAAVQALWSRGGEGVILKRLTSGYRPGHRSADWIKVKANHAATLTVIGFEAGKCGPYSKLKLRDGAGIETTCKTLGNALLGAITKAPDTYLGRRVVISYQEKTPSGTYRHGIFDHFAGEAE